MDLGKQIRNKLTADGISVPGLSVILGVPKDRIYKWIKGSKPSDMEDYLKVNKWLESVPHGTKNGKAHKGADTEMFSTPINTSDAGTQVKSANDKNQPASKLEDTVKMQAQTILLLTKMLESKLEQS